MVKAEFVYADDGTVTSMDLGWLQLALDLLTGIFDRVGMQTNLCKSVGTMLRLFRESGVRADETYTLRMRGEGRSFKERQKERVLWPEYRNDLAKGSLMTHRQTQHGMAKGRLGLEGYKADGGVDEPRTYNMAFATKAGPRTCLVKG